MSAFTKSTMTPVIFESIALELAHKMHYIQQAPTQKLKCMVQKSVLVKFDACAFLSVKKKNNGLIHKA